MRVLALLSMVSMAFAGDSISFDHKHKAEARSSAIETGVCDDTTWVNEVFTGAAFINSCIALRDNLRNSSPKDGFVFTGWKKDDPYYLLTAGIGDCVFEVNVVDPVDGQRTTITNKDMADILTDAIAKFPPDSDQCFGASGTMDCKDGDLAGTIAWRIDGVELVDTGNGCRRAPSSDESSEQASLADDKVQKEGLLRNLGKVWLRRVLQEANNATQSHSKSAPDPS
ncbi:hypothetical protein NPX13_g7475 [Xylaria arbuscula]|uniref:Ecp2 effector protein-like domain-containing protein n=1 Tax=Xylaria arbuscula TaxID=114810 RepID=A0A9W8TJ74_9PEZI|nr:hypothetical protein NPX13_g7475 [Xylaria arbuscula]